MLDRDRYEAVARRWRFDADTGNDLVDRWLVSRRISARYRELGLPPPVHARLASPIAASIAAGIATGVRWLQRHPETHRRLFARNLDGPALAHAIRAAATTALGGDDALVDSVVRTITRVTARPPRWLPERFRAIQVRHVEPLSRAPTLAVDEGWIEDCALDLPLASFRALFEARLSPEDAAAMPSITDPLAPSMLLRLRRPRTGSALPEAFLGDCLSAWATLRWSRPRMSSLVFVEYFAPRTIGSLARVVRRPTFLHADFWITSDPPRRVTHDARGRLHRFGGPAVEWRDGTSASYVDGVAVTDDIARGKFGVADVLRELNVLVRRAMIAVYDRDGACFLRDADATMIAFDEDRLGHRRRLLSLDLPGDEPYVAVEVTNSTPDPDGTHRRYYLRVPPGTRSCREAVAWTFGLSADELEPSAES